ncbi:hypothetical protein ACT3UJ_06650 [Halomonas sp. 86]|uniref:hypothetical protein n=1 Tax=unclassified Halomonas TaxID=2609666 RepID=UPI004034DDE9
MYTGFADITTQAHPDSLTHTTQVRFYIADTRSFDVEVYTATLNWSKADAGKRLPMAQFHPKLTSIVLSDNPITREVEDKMVEGICVEVFGKCPVTVARVIEHRQLADQGRARGGRCADLARTLQYQLGEGYRALTLARLGDRLAIRRSTDLSQEALHAMSDADLAASVLAILKENQIRLAQQEVPASRHRVPPLADLDQLQRIKRLYQEGKLVRASERRYVARVARKYPEWVQSLGLPTEGRVSAW